MAVHSYFIEPLHQVVTPLAVAFPHLEHGIRAVFQCLNGRFLRGDGRAEHGVLVDFHHGGDEGLRPAGVTEAESRHRKGLGDAVQQQRALPHARQGGNGDVRLAVVPQFAVDFIRQHNEIVLDADARDFLEGFHGATAPVGFVGKLSISTLFWG